MNVELGYRMMEKKLEISAGMDMLSGHDSQKASETNDDGTLKDSTYANTNHTFDLLNGGRHLYYGGHLDYFITRTT